MRVISLFVLAGTLSCVTSERHSLIDIYTALTRPGKYPGIHEFTAMGLLDSKMIDYFDSDLQEMIPKKSWMKENLKPDYWTKGTESRKSQQQWLKVILDSVKDRMNQTDDDLHVLQWMQGCEADLVPDDSAPSGKRLMFQRGIDQYSYDGDSFIYFDYDLEVWVADTPAAEPTKREWDDVKGLKDLTKAFLEMECPDWLEKFMDYGKAQLQHAAPPKVYMFASKSKVKSVVVLTCMATGFYPRDIVLNIRRNGRVLNEEDGVKTTGIRPNGDDTYQRRDSILILRTDTANYTCEVNHAATSVSIIKEWDHILPELEDDVGGGPVGAVVGGVIIVLLVGVVAVVVLVNIRRGKQRQRDQFLPKLEDDVGGAVVGGVIVGLLLAQVEVVVGVLLVRRRQDRRERPVVFPNKPLVRVIVAEARPLENKPLIPPNNGDSSRKGSSEAEGSSESLHKDSGGSRKSSDSALDVVPNEPLGRVFVADPKPLEKDSLIPPNDDDSNGKGSSKGSSDGSFKGSSDGSSKGSSDGSSESLHKDSGGSYKPSDTALGNYTFII